MPQNAAHDQCLHYLPLIQFLDALTGNKIELTHCCRDTHKRVIGKQWRPGSDAAESGV